MDVFNPPDSREIVCGTPNIPEAIAAGVNDKNNNADIAILK
jgi:hypothetical protein